MLCKCATCSQSSKEIRVIRNVSVNSTCLTAYDHENWLDNNTILDNRQLVRSCHKIICLLRVNYITNKLLITSQTCYSAWLCSRTGQERTRRTSERLGMAANEKVIGRAAYNHVRIVDIKTRKHRTYSTRRLPNDVTVRPTIKLYGFSWVSFLFSELLLCRLLG